MPKTKPKAVKEIKAWGIVGKKGLYPDAYSRKWEAKFNADAKEEVRRVSIRVIE